MGKQGKSDNEEGIAPGLVEFEEELEDAGIELEGESTFQDDTPESDEPTSDDADSGADDEPTGDAEPVAASDQDAEVEEPEAGEVDDEPTDSTDADPTFTVPDDKFFGELRGKEATASQLEEAGLLTKMLSRDHQVSHFQKLYEDEKENRSKLEERVTSLEKPADPTEPELTPEQYAEAVQKEFEPVAQGLVEAGLMEADYVAMNPKKAALDEYRVQIVSTGMDEFDKRIKQLEQRVEPWQEKEQVNEAVQNVGGLIVGMVKENEELYGGLKDEEVQSKFFDYLQDKERSGIRFTPGNATPQDMRGAWIGFLLDTGGELPVGGKTEAPVKGQRGKTSTGGKPRGRGNAPAGGEKDEFAEFEDQLEKAEASQYE